MQNGHCLLGHVLPFPGDYINFKIASQPHPEFHIVFCMLTVPNISCIEYSEGKSEKSSNLLLERRKLRIILGATLRISAPLHVEMAKLHTVVTLWLIVILRVDFSSAKTQKMKSVGYDIGRPVETACYGSDISFQTDSDINGMYVGVPPGLFDNGKNCGKKIQVSCVGGKPKCKNQKSVELTIIDTLNGDFIEISNKAFNTISDFDIGIIQVKVKAD